MGPEIGFFALQPSSGVFFTGRPAGGRIVGLLSGDLPIALVDTGIERIELVAHGLNQLADRRRLRGIELVLDEFAPQLRRPAVKSSR